MFEKYEKFVSTPNFDLNRDSNTTKLAKITIATKNSYKYWFNFFLYNFFYNKLDRSLIWTQLKSKMKKNKAIVSNNLIAFFHVFNWKKIEKNSVFHSTLFFDGEYWVRRIVKYTIMTFNPIEMTAFDLWT